MKTASATVRLANPTVVLDALAAHMAEHEIDVQVIDGAARASLPSGKAAMWIESCSIKLEASAASQAALEDITGFLASHLVEFAHPERPAIAWSGFQVSETFSDFREMRVLAVSDLTRTLRRVRLTGKDLDRFAAPDNLHVRLFFPPDGQQPAWPTRGSDGLAQPPLNPAQKPSVRKYTIRCIDAEAEWVDIDFVLHEDPGPGSDWAKRAQPKDLVGMAGPGGRTAKPAEWMLLAGDETALPAIARILETLPPATRGITVIEVLSIDNRIALKAPEHVEIRWLVKSGDSSALANVVQSIPVPHQASRFCWAGAEFQAIQAIRHYWRDDCGLNGAEQLAVAYWRKGTPDA